MSEEMDRRRFINLGLMAICAPAIVRASSLMPIRAWEPEAAPMGRITGVTWYTHALSAEQVKEIYDNPSWWDEEYSPTSNAESFSQPQAGFPWSCHALTHPNSKPT